MNPENINTYVFGNARQVPVVPSQENDGCPMSVVGNVKTFVAALCSMNIWAISELAKTFFLS
jgi:hypothetical protein